jgi:SNF1-activating kinase 1
MKTPLAREAESYFQDMTPVSSSTSDHHGTGTAQRSNSTKSRSSSSLHRHSKSATGSIKHEHPGFPNQSFSALSSRPPLRSRSSHPAQNLLYNDIRTSRTADNTPMSSPGLFEMPRSPSAPPKPAESLHYLQMPKETYVVEVETDMYSGNKIINNYEVVRELGRGEHGKVKLANDLQRQAPVAVKIVPRYSRMRRLGRLGAPEDRTKKEVAILKKARHRNVVSLLEVIDDPNKNKVYIILEYVERGEILWRKKGVPEVVKIANTRYDMEKEGAEPNLELEDKEAFALEMAKKRHDWKQRLPVGMRDWSLEHGPSDSHSDISRTASKERFPSRTQSHDELGDDLAGSMYGSYAPEVRDRKYSLAWSAISHMSSEHPWEEDDELSFVPALTMEEARRAFKDTLLGLEFLHYIHIIHRDIKPANLLVAKDGTVKISDFGVSYLGRPVTEADAENKLTDKDVSALDDDKELSKSVGTPAFWAPEVIFEDPEMFHDGKPPKITGALDLWALGITLYCMIYARLPFYADENGLHENICHQEPFIPKYRLMPVDTTSPDAPVTEAREINSNKRIDFEVKFERVPDDVRDLIAQLLTKDPAFRMTIADAKRHPWVLEGEPDPTQFISGLDLPAPKERILQPDEKEVERAVAKISLLDKVTNAAKSTVSYAGNLLSRARSERKRASSANSSGDTTPSPQSTATIKGPKAEEVAAHLKASREHPLAQSETSSPHEGPADYFDDERRPRAPDRAVSHADSVRTVKATRAGLGDFVQTVENLMEGATTTLNRWSQFTERSPSSTRANPSLGLSTESVTGSIETPEELRSQTPFEQAQEINTRRLIAETQAAKTEQDVITPVTDDCPPSPDDETMYRPPTDIAARPSESTIASSADDLSTHPSNPSFGINSNASSPPTDQFLIKLRGDEMKTTDTVRHVGRPLEDQWEEGEFDDEDEDEGLMMGSTSSKR